MEYIIEPTDFLENLFSTQFTCVSLTIRCGAPCRGLACSSFSYSPAVPE